MGEYVLSDLAMNHEFSSSHDLGIALVGGILHTEPDVRR